MHAVTGMIRNISMLRRKTQPQFQPTISLPVIDLSQSEDGGSKRTSTISADRVSNNGYEITDGGNSNMKVVVRVRPENQVETRSNCETIVKILDDHVLVFDPKEDNDPDFQGNCATARKRRALLSRKRRDLRFAFDRVFDENSKQTDVFEHTTKTVIDGLLDGVNCSVFAYGATGAGKTHTMLGSSDNPGVMFLTTMELYERIDQLKHDKNCQITVTYLEVYNETIRDLLSPSGPLAMREDSSKGLVVAGLTQHQPTSAKDLLQMLEIGNKNRTQHPTDANATSSRSHAVFQVFVHQKPRTAGFSTEVTQGKMSLIDLAGSERATVTTNRGARLREGANINKSLLALGNCINALASNKGKSCHVPYRNSKLTRLLKDSLGGSCKTVMIANISPSSLTYEDTYNTLKYADRAKQIKTKLIRNVVNVDYHVTRYRTIVIGLQKEIEELKTQLHITARPPLNLTEVERLKQVIGNVYTERTRLRRNMADLDAAERDTLLRALRKERELERIEVLTADDRKISKIKGKLNFLRNHLQDIKEQKTIIHLELSKNNESIGKTLSDINSTIKSDCDGFDILRSHIDVILDASKLEAENSYQWKQTKHLLKYIKNQEKEISKTEKVLRQSLELVSKQYQVLQATKCSTPVIHDLYNGLVRQIEGEKEVGWTMEHTHDSLHDVSVSSFAPTHQALMNTIIAHSSPLRKVNRSNTGSRYSSPINAASLGLLTVSNKSVVTMPTSPKSPFLQFSDNQSCHPLSNRLVATPEQSAPFKVEDTSSKGFAGKVLNSPMKSSYLMKRCVDHCFSPGAVNTQPDLTRNRPNSKQARSRKSPLTSPKLKTKKVVFDSPPPCILEVEDETDFTCEHVASGSSPSVFFSESANNSLFPPSPPPRIEDITSTKEAIVAYTGAKNVKQKFTSSAKTEEKSHERVTKSDKCSTAFVSSSSPSPPKYRINLAELTRIHQSTTYSTSTKTTESPKTPSIREPQVTNGFEDDFVASYPTYSKPKVQHTPVGKSLSFDNPIYATRGNTNGSSFTPCRPTHSCQSPYAFRTLPNQHPAFPLPPTQHVYTPIVTSPIPPPLQKPAFLPVSRNKTTPKIEYRSPVNIPVHPLPNIPPPPIPSPSSLCKSRSAFTKSTSSSVSSSGQLSDNSGFLLHPALPSGGATVHVTKTSKSHRYSLTSPTQARDNIFLSLKEKSESEESSSHKDDQLNSTFTISTATSSKEKRRYAVLEPLPSSCHQKDKSNSKASHGQAKKPPHFIRPLTVVQVGLTDSTDSQSGSSQLSAERKQPNYLTLTKSAAFKKVNRVTHEMKNQKENFSASHGTIKSQSVNKAKMKTMNRSVSNRSHSASAST